MVGRRCNKPKIPRFRNRSIVPDEDAVSRINDSSLDMFTLPILRKKNVQPEQRSKTLSKKQKENVGVRKNSKRKKKADETFCSFPTPLKEKMDEINEIDENYQLHVTKGSTNVSNRREISRNNKFSKSQNNASTKSTEQFPSNTIQIGTSTPSLFDRSDRKACLDVDISQLEMFPTTPLFENSREGDELINETSYTRNKQTFDVSSATKHSIVRSTIQDANNRAADFINYETSSSDNRKEQSVEEISSLKRSLRSFKQSIQSTTAEKNNELVSDNNKGRTFDVSKKYSERNSEILSDINDGRTFDVSKYSERNIEIGRTSDRTSKRSTKNSMNQSVREEEEEEEDQLASLINELSFDNDKQTVNSTNQSLQSSKSICRMSFVGVCSPYFAKNRASLRYDARSIVYKICDQENGPIPWRSAIPDAMMNKCCKIGEGTYAEVFQTENLQGESVALKIIPIEGDFPVNDEPQKKFDEILPEILIATEISNLRNNERNNTPNFVEVKSVSCVIGPYPDELLNAWDDFKLKRVSENDRPDGFNDEQLFIIFEFANCGTDLENYNFNSPDQAKSVIVQLTLTLAIAEKVLEFEHRDLHIGNVLIKNTKEKFIKYEFESFSMKVKTYGVHVFIIDFTNSRLHKENCTIFTDLAKDDGIFEGAGDYQFDIYRGMKELNGNEWKHFEPKSNILWLHYLTDKLCKFKKYRGKPMGLKLQSTLLNYFAEELLQHSSCEDFVANNENDMFHEMVAYY